VDIYEEAYLISVALLRRHLSDDQRAVLALKYAEILSKARRSEQAKKAVQSREWRPVTDKSIVLDTASNTIEPTETTITSTRAEVAKKFKIPERKLKYIKEIQEVKPEVIPQILAGEKKILEVKREIEKEKPKPAPVFDGTYQIIYADPSITLKQKYGVSFSNNKISDKNSVFSRTTWTNLDIKPTYPHGGIFYHMGKEG